MREENCSITCEERTMLGRKLDTKILRFISHDRNKMTEEQIEAAAQKFVSKMSYTPPDEDFRKFTQRAGAYFDWKGKRILDVACGRGDLANHLAMRGASEVYGIDIQNQHIAVGKSVAAKNGISNVQFFECNFHQWVTAERFDYVISYEALDHIPDAKKTLKKMAGLLKDNGKIINFAAGFWLGPSADHCDDFMRIFIPWRHLLFNEQALFAVRREKFRPNDPATSFKEIRGGLSMYTLSEYKKAIHDAGLEVVAWETNYQLKYRLGGVLYPLSGIVSRVPFLGEYFVFSTLAVLAK
jgi:ubiquinone/menaquinone biosynthesis C-methylase UbiE